MENCKGGSHIRPRGVEDADPYKPKSRTVGSAYVRTAAFPQETICLTREQSFVDFLHFIFIVCQIEENIPVQFPFDIPEYRTF